MALCVKELTGGLKLGASTARALSVRSRSLALESGAGAVPRHRHGRRAAVATIPSRISPEVGSQGTRNVARTFALPSVRASAQPRKAVAPSFVVSNLAVMQRDFAGRRIGFSGGANATVRIRVHRWVRAGSPGFLPQATTLEARNAT